MGGGKEQAASTCVDSAGFEDCGDELITEFGDLFPAPKER